MSYDLGVWFSDAWLRAADADRIYGEICQGAPSPERAESGKVRAFREELLSIYPSIDSYSDEEIDTCPWSCDFGTSNSGLALSMVWSRADELDRMIRNLARKHELTLYDPQEGEVTLPDGSRDRLRPVPRQDGASAPSHALAAAGKTSRPIFKALGILAFLAPVAGWYLFPSGVGPQEKPENPARPIFEKIVDLRPGHWFRHSFDFFDRRTLTVEAEVLEGPPVSLFVVESYLAPEQGDMAEPKRHLSYLCGRDVTEHRASAKVLGGLYVLLLRGGSTPGKVRLRILRPPDWMEEGKADSP